MDQSNFTSTQMILAWTLLGLLLLWMVVCAVLAFRQPGAEQQQAATMPIPSGSFPAALSRTSLQRMTVPAVEVSRAAVPADKARDMEAAPVA